MANMTLVMDSFVFKEATVSIDWPIWLYRFENFLVLSTIDIATIQGAAIALRHLIHSGGMKIMDIFAAQGNPALTYGQFKAILDARFVTPINKLHVITMRNCHQDPDQTLEDYLTLLHRLAINAAIPLAQRENEILHVIAQNAQDEETRIKALAPDTTLTLLKAWHAAQQSIVKCSKMISSSRRDNDTINAVKEETPRECFNCGNRYPHQLGTTCPALGKECNRCHKLNHFGKVCFKEASRRPITARPTRDQGFNNNRHNRDHQYDRSRSHSRNQSRDRNHFNERRERDTPSRSHNDSQSSKRRIRQVNEANLFERFKTFAGLNRSSSNNESSPEEKKSRSTPKSASRNSE
jgi:hypothetical protein